MDHFARFWRPATLRLLTGCAALVGLAALEAWRGLRSEGGLAASRRADLYLGVLLALLAFCVAGLFEDNWADTEVQRVILFILALPFCLRGRSLAETAAQEATGDGLASAAPSRT